jgi:hypothetical protein
MRGIRLRGDLPGGRKELQVQVGQFSVAVTEVPGRSMADHEWRELLLARQSYTAMWGVPGADLASDPFDGRDGGVYDTTHYLARVSDAVTAPKLVTMRKVRLAVARLDADQRADPGMLLPVDVRFWRIRTPGGDVPLWVALKARARRLAPRDRLAEFRIAAMERVAAFPHREPQRTDRERERTAIAFAAIQILATRGDSNLLHVWSICPEFRDRVAGVRDVDGVYVAPAFRRTEEVLGLPRGSVGMDTTLDVVREHKARFPGYFVDNDDAARLIHQLLDQGRMRAGDLGALIRRLIREELAFGSDRRPLEELAALVARPDHRRLAEILTRPSLFKHLVPVMTGEYPLTGMSAAELRDRLVGETGDGPFSAMAIPTEWAASARAVLEAAEVKYGSAGTSRPRRQDAADARA